MHNPCVEGLLAHVRPTRTESGVMKGALSLEPYNIAADSASTTVNLNIAPALRIFGTVAPGFCSPLSMCVALTSPSRGARSLGTRRNRPGRRSLAFPTGRSQERGSADICHWFKRGLGLRKTTAKNKKSRTRRRIKHFPPETPLPKHVSQGIPSALLNLSFPESECQSS